jgi:hypothetical protein
LLCHLAAVDESTASAAAKELASLQKKIAEAQKQADAAEVQLQEAVQQEQDLAAQLEDSKQQQQVGDLQTAAGLMVYVCPGWPLAVQQVLSSKGKVGISQ